MVDKIEVKMTWADVLGPLLAVYAYGTPKGRADALKELRRMAQAADMAVAELATSEDEDG